MLPAIRPTVLVGTAAAAVLLAGCGSSGGDGETGRRAVASFYPLAWAAGQVAGDEWQVTNLTQPGTEPHDLSLSVLQTAEIGEADLMIVLGGFQPAVDRAVETGAEGALIDAADVVELLSADGHEHGADEHGADEHDGGDLDLHFWLDPLLMADLGDAIAEQLGDLDPDQAASYDDRAKALRETMTALDDKYSSTLSNCARDHVVVSHAAFNYLSRYGLHFEAIAGLSPDAEPSAADLARLQELIETEGLTTVFSERLVSPRAAEALAADTGAKVDVLDPIEGLSDQTTDEDYVSLMEANLDALQKALDCR